MILEKGTRASKKPSAFERGPPSVSLSVDRYTLRVNLGAVLKLCGAGPEGRPASLSAVTYPL
jgi:hypothetical protein